MTDLGFDFVDRRSVIVVLFTLGLSYFVIGNPLPIDTSNALSIFLGLLVFTGFIYCARTIPRLCLTLVYFVLRIPFDIATYFFEERTKLRGLRGIILIIGKGVSHSFLFGFQIPNFIFRDWKFRISYRDTEITLIPIGILGIIDRLFLIAISYLATIPAFYY